MSHSSFDKPAVRELRNRLRTVASIDPWLDEDRLLPGQDWKMEIARAVRTTDVVLVCLSTAAVTKAGYLQKELRLAIDIADQQPAGAIFVIPVRLEPCLVPEEFQRWQWVDYFDEAGFDRLLRALHARGEQLSREN